MDPFIPPAPSALLADLNRLHDLLSDDADHAIPVLHDVVPHNDYSHLQPLLDTSARQLMQDVIQDFMPQITAELERRLQQHLQQLIHQQQPQPAPARIDDPFSFQP